MGKHSFQLQSWLFLGTLTVVISAPAFAQRPGGTGTASRTTTTPRNNTPDTSVQPAFVYGRVTIEGGGPLSEPVAIERICNGVVRREGYTDFKGQFQLQLGQNFGFQDASENDTRTAPAPIVRSSGQSNSRQGGTLQGCEFRAVLAGFVSTTVLYRYTGDSFQTDIGTIILKRMGDSRGSTVSVTSMSAPKNARAAYEKAEHSLEQNKLDDAEKELNKAVRDYPQFAAAWSLLGDLHQKKEQLDHARDDYQKSIEADPQYVNPAFGLALIAMQQKKWEEAARYTAQASSLNAYAYPVAYFYNAVSNYNMAKYEEAELSARKYKSVDSDHKHPDVSLLLSSVLEIKKDYAGAAQEIREYLQIVPNSPKTEELTFRLKTLDDLSMAKK
ncbi:MAG TPA: tetratricopeptide repeat protein [Candidatus Angelobacter sp.]|jgi:tetratricopeptide (TPR) repeat protein|nr:tetratricopeptide repeat protein [Candidatus Angelobacter sp.]